MPPAPRHRSLLALALLSAGSALADDAALPRPAPVGAQAAALPGLPEVPLLGPRGTLGVDVYRRRRGALLEKLKTGAALTVNEMSYDGLREGMDFYYLTGLDEAGASLLLEPSAADPAAREQLFLARLEVETDRWNGPRTLLPSNALEVATGLKTLKRSGGLPGALVDACAHKGGLAYLGTFVAEPRPKPKVMELYGQAQGRTYGCNVNSLEGTLARMREVKEPAELALMRQAIGYTAAGHAAATRAIRPGAREYEVKDAVEGGFRAAGSRHLAYESIVGSGTNGAFLHYPKDDRVMKAGELVVIDAAAEAEYYASDVTRTYPVSGKFSSEQREIYDLVLKAQLAGIAAARAGARVSDIDRATRKVIQEGGYYDFYLHGCCHFVGLEVHDPGDYDAPLPVGAVLTVEPGIYLPHRGFGVRIEDEVLITATGSEVLTKAIPKDPEEVERAMAAGRGKPLTP